MIGIYGGTFDPVHHGHLRAALEVKEALGLEQVRFVPAAVPPHRQRPSVSAEQRLQLLQLAIEGVPGFIVDRRELDRGGPSYMIDTLTSLRQAFPDASLCLILGEDAFFGLSSWHRWQDLLTQAHVVVTNRADQAPMVPPALVDVIQPRLCSEPERLRASTHGCVHFCRISSLDISATRIRHALSHGQSAKYWVPDAVLDSIRQQGLYVLHNHEV